MPNHVTNRVRLTGEEATLQEIVELLHCADPRRPFDFNELIPMPEGLRGTVSPARGETAEENTKKFGFPSWYEWSLSQWGTKWNSYSHMEWPGKEEPLVRLGQAAAPPDGLQTITYVFDTAWSPPAPVILTLARRFPAVHISHEAIDEGGNFSYDQDYLGGAADPSSPGEYSCHDGDVYTLTDWIEGFRPEEDPDDE